VWGSLAELLRRFPERGRQIQAERRVEKERQTSRRRPTRSKKKARGESERLRAAEKATQLAEEKARAEKERADTLERLFQEALKKDREAAAERRKRATEARRLAEPRHHAAWEGPPSVDLRDLLSRLSDRTLGDLKVHGVRVHKLRRGVAVYAYARDPETGERYRLRGYEIVKRWYDNEGKQTGERRYVFWGDRDALGKYAPAKVYEEIVSPPDEAGPRPPDEDMIIAWEPS
jgi:hypothetical protein